MKKYLLPQEGTFYKTNLHCHTTISDGKLTPEEVKAAYKAKGYSAVAFTDHEVLIGHKELCDDSFIALHGYETSVKNAPGITHTTPEMHVYHLNFLAKKQENLTQICFYPENFTPGNCAKYIPFVHYKGERCKYEYSVDFVNRLIREANENGFLVTYNHPRWSLQTEAEYLPLQGLHAMEVHNTGCVFHGDCNASVYQQMLTAGMRILPVAADDNHNAHGYNDSFGGFTMIKAKELSYDALMEAWERKDAYASSHPLIEELWLEDGYITIRTSPVRSILLRGETRYCRHKQAEAGSTVTEATFRYEPDYLGAFFRLEAEDNEGRAYTRAYFIDELN